MRLVSGLLILLVLLAMMVDFGDSQFFYDNVKIYGCRCLQKDQTSHLLNSLTRSIPINANRPIWNPSEASAGNFASNLKSKIHYLKQWLAALTLDTPTAPPTTTTPRPTSEDPVALPFDDPSLGNGAFMKTAYKVMSKYFKKFRTEWTILDRFECVCDGNLIDLLKAKTFLNIQIAHD